MHKLIRFALLCLMAGSAIAQGSLPLCKGIEVNKWDRCFGVEPRRNYSSSTGYFAGEFMDGLRSGRGTYTYFNGDRFVGEYKNHQPNGMGIEYKSDGTIIASGVYKDGKLVSSFAVETNRYPFDLTTQTAAANSISIHESDRLKSAAESERKKRQELEHQLASNRERDRITTELDFERRKRQELQAELDRAKELAESRLTERPRPQSEQRLERRVALVIGNAQYKSSPLENSVNDATDIEQALKRFGFQTTFLRNASLGQMREATRRFAD